MLCSKIAYQLNLMWSGRTWLPNNYFDKVNQKNGTMLAHCYRSSLKDSNL